MTRSSLMVCVVAAVAGSCGSSASAYEIRQRFVHRFENQDHVISGDFYSVPAPFPNTPVRIRLQFGVFDTDSGPAPEGGFVGWNTGRITKNFGSEFTLRRTLGRLSPFTFATPPGANGSPVQDPFNDITDIDNTLGLQTPSWPAGADPDAPPAPVIRGLNTFVSVYEITLSTGIPYVYPSVDITFSGNMIAALDWRTVGIPNPPTPDEPGQITYAPFPIAPVAFIRTLHVQVTPDVPTPGSASGLLVVGAALSLRRRRRRMGV